MAAPASVVAMVMMMFIPEVRSISTVSMNVVTSREIHEVGSKFVGVTLDAGLISKHWSSINLRDATIRAMARALAPCYLRVGGTSADALTFDPNTHVTKAASRTITNFTITSEDWEELNEFVAAANWSLIFGLNVLKRSGHSWDPTNARQLLDFSQRRGYVLAGLELGNEPGYFHSTFNTSVSPEQLARDFKTLPEVKDAYPNFRSAMVLGPDIGRLSTVSNVLYLSTFLASGGGQAVDVVTFHHYYTSGVNATLPQLIDVELLDSLRIQVQTGLDLGSAHAPGKPLWLGETSSCSHGGAPGISDRYVASFMWLDKLGMAAQMGLQGVMRQSYFGGHYSLLNSTHQPTSDYWVTVLYKRLVGGRVLSVSTSDSSNHTRVYAHCARGSNGVVLFAMNLNTEPVQLQLSPFPNTPLRLYVFSPEDGDLLSRSVLLNGKVLAMNGQELPPLTPIMHQGPVTLPGQRFAFIQVDDVTVPACTS